MRREGDRGYILSGSEALQVIRTGEFSDLKAGRGIIVDQSITNMGVKYERMFVFAGKPQMELFEGICASVKPPIEIPAQPR